MICEDISKIENYDKADNVEIWKPVKDYEGLYEVSDQGRVRSLNYNHTGMTKLLKPVKYSGYLVVKLCKDGHVKRMGVHRLVAETFIPNPQHLPQVNHIDENKLNNAASNLEWCTASYNTNYGTRNKRVAEALRGRPLSAERRKNISEAMGKPVQQLDKVTGEVLATFHSTREAGRAVGGGNISACCRGKCKSAGGYVWRYVDNNISKLMQ